MRKLASLIANYREEGAKLMQCQKGQNPMQNNISNEYNEILEPH